MKKVCLYIAVLLSITIGLVSCTNNKVYRDEKNGLTFEYPPTWEPVFLHDNFLSIQRVEQGLVKAEIGVLFLDLPDNLDAVEIMDEILRSSRIGKLIPLGIKILDRSSSSDSITIVSEPHFVQHNDYNGASASVIFNGLANLQVSEDVSITVDMHGLTDLLAIENEDYLVVIYRFDPLLDQYTTEQLDIIESFKFSSSTGN